MGTNIGHHFGPFARCTLILLLEVDLVESIKIIFRTVFGLARYLLVGAVFFIVSVQ